LQLRTASLQPLRWSAKNGQHHLLLLRALYAHATEFEVSLPDVPNAQDFMLMSAFGNGGAVRHIAFKTKSQ